MTPSGPRDQSYSARPIILHVFLIISRRRGRLERQRCPGASQPQRSHLKTRKY